MSLADEIYNAPSAKKQWDQPEQPGLVLAKVTNIKDPKNLGRIKCQALMDTEKQETDWCYMMAPLAGKEHGIQFMPDVGDMVVMGFLAGNVQTPVILGCLWNSNLPMPYPVQDGKNESFAIKTAAGTEINMLGEKGKEKLTILTPAGTQILLDDENKAIQISDKDAKNAVKIDLQGGEMQILADKKITLKTGSASLVMESSGKAELKADSGIKMSGANIEVKANSKFAAEGAQVEVKANAQLNLQSSGIAALKGSMLNLN